MKHDNARFFVGSITFMSTKSMERSIQPQYFRACYGALFKVSKPRMRLDSNMKYV